MIELLVGAAALAGMLFCAARVINMSWGTHAKPVVVMHAMLLLANAAVLAQCVQKTLGLDLAGAAGAAIAISTLCWVAYSWPTWGLRGTPPRHTESGRGAFDPLKGANHG